MNERIQLYRASNYNIRLVYWAF